MFRQTLAASVLAVLVHASVFAAEEAPFSTDAIPPIEQQQRIDRIAGAAPGGRVVDNLVATPWAVEGNTANVKAGLSCTTVGDVNADGYSDVVVTWDGVTSGTGIARLYLGGAGGLSSSPVWSRTNFILGPKAAPAGDVNGDGYGDFMVGWADIGGVGAGQVNVYYGSFSGVPTGPFTRSSTGGSVGWSFNTAGDINGDGYDDIVIGCPRWSCGATDNGLFELYYGGPTGIIQTNSVSYCQNLGANAHFGYSVCGAGDINADGYDDVVVGAPDYAITSGPFAPKGGYVAVYLGSAGGLGSTFTLPAIRMSSSQIGCRYGAVVAPAGDFNADGYADIVVSAPNFGASGYDEVGDVLIYAGNSSPSGSLSVLWAGYEFQPYGHFGGTLAPAGDVNGDGYSDVAIGAPDYDGTFTDGGYAWILYGRIGGAPMNAQTIWGGMTSEHFSSAIGTAGDVDGDGFSDLIIGSYGWANPEFQEGRAVLYRGRADAPQLTPQFTSLGNEWFENVGWSVAAAGDVNGDGYGDAIVGAWLYDGPSAYDIGRASIYMGGPTGLSPSPSPDLLGDEWGAAFGFNVARAGDVNGDGYEDVIVGQPYGWPPRAKIFPGGYLGVSSTPIWTGTGAPGSVYGVTVAGAGDVNGDGYADVLVGAPLDDTFGNDTGRAYLYLGGPGGPSTTPARTFHGSQSGEQYGNSVCGAGDLNGDGRSDIAIGAPLYDSGSETDAGRVEVYFGTSVNVETLPHHSFVYFQSMHGGAKVVGVGDVNGDGYADLGVSAPAFIFNYLNQGLVYVYAGGPSGLGINPIWGIVGPEPEGQFGTSFDTAGDVNGDGNSDILVGSFMLGGTSDNGGVYLYTEVGSSTPAWQKYGDSAGDWFGFSIAGAGDVNGDGFSDVLVGAAAAEANGYQDAGKAFVYLSNLTVSDDGMDRILRIRRADDSAPVAPLGFSPTNQVRVGTLARSASGPGKLTAEFRLEPKGGGATTVATFGPLPTTTGPGGASVALHGLTPTLLAGKRYSVKARVRSRSPFFPSGPWLTPVLDGRAMMDFRTHGATLDAPVANGEGALDFAAPFPNPSRGEAMLAFTLPAAGKAKLTIHDVAGREIVRLADREFRAGPHRMTWSGVDERGQMAPAGIYFAKLTTPDGERVQRVVRMR